MEETISLFPSGAPAILRNTSTPFISFASGGNPAAVPQGQWWYVDQLAVQLLLPLAADNAIFQGGINTSPGTVPNFWYGCTNVVADVVTARANRVAQSFLSRPFWAPPGSVFGVTVFDSVTAGNLTYTLNLRAVRLPN